MTEGTLSAEEMEGAPPWRMDYEPGSHIRIYAGDDYLIAEMCLWGDGDDTAALRQATLLIDSVNERAALLAERDELRARIADDDEAFATAYKAALGYSDGWPAARVLSGRLREMDKRAKAANVRADRAESSLREYGWQPIETAPRGTTPFIAGGWQWVPEEFRDDGAEGEPDHIPDHWQWVAYRTQWEDTPMRRGWRHRNGGGGFATHWLPAADFPAVQEPPMLDAFGARAAIRSRTQETSNG